MGTNCAPLEADMFLFCYKRDFMLSLSDYNQSEIVEAVNSTTKCLRNHGRTKGEGWSTEN